MDGDQQLGRNSLIRSAHGKDDPSLQVSPQPWPAQHSLRHQMPGERAS